MYEDRVLAYKQEYHAINVAEMALGAPVKTDPTGALWFCPFHDDRGTPNFHVTSHKDRRYPDHFKCFTAHCKFNGGDIFDFLRELYGHNYYDAMDEIDNGRLRDSDTPIVLKSVSAAEKVKEYVIAPPHPLETAEKYHANLDEDHRVYYWTRGLTDETIDRFLLGYDPRTHRYVTPYRNTVGVYDFKRRRDDWWVEADLKAKGEAWMQDQMERIWQKRLENTPESEEPRIPTVKDVIKANYPKYIWGKKDTGVRWLFNEDRLIRGKGYWLPYVFLTADEMSALSLEQAGFPAVCWSGDAAFPNASDKIKYTFHGKVVTVTIRDVFKAALSIYIVADGDQSGIFAAKKRRAALGRGEIVQVPISEGIKDPADYLAKGFTVAEWLPHIPPILGDQP